MIFDRGLLAHNLVQEVLVQDCYKVRRLFGAPIDTVVDIGANYGIFSVLSRFYWPTAAIHAIEPHEETHKGLIQNTAFLAITTHRLALGDGGFIAMRRGGASSGVAIAEPTTATATDRVQSMGLAEIFKRLNVQPGPRVFLKIDVEGSERVLRNDPESTALLGQLGGFGMEIHAQTSKWPSSPTKMEWLQWLNDQRAPLKLSGLDVDIGFGTNIGYFCARRVP